MIKYLPPQNENRSAVETPCFLSRYRKIDKSPERGYEENNISSFIDDALENKQT
jgi:hypothetical protein